MQLLSWIQFHCFVFSMIYFDFFKVLLLLQQQHDYDAGRAEINFKSIWRQTPQLWQKSGGTIANLIFLFYQFSHLSEKIYNKKAVSDQGKTLPSFIEFEVLLKSVQRGFCTRFQWHVGTKHFRTSIQLLNKTCLAGHMYMYICIHCRICSKWIL